MPVLGINLGRVGYMAELELGELDLLSRLFAVDSAGNPMWHTETRSMLGVEILTAAREVRASMYGLNDAVITNGSIARIIDIELYENGLNRLLHVGRGTRCGSARVLLLRDAHLPAHAGGASADLPG